MKVNGLAPHFQIELTKSGRMDAMTVHVESTKDAGSTDAQKASAKDLAERIKDVVGITAKIDVSQEGGVARSQGKAVRVVDNRSKSS